MALPGHTCPQARGTFMGLQTHIPSLSSIIVISAVSGFRITALSVVASSPKKLSSFSNTLSSSMIMRTVMVVVILSN